MRRFSREWFIHEAAMIAFWLVVFGGLAYITVVAVDESKRPHPRLPASQFER